MSTDKASIPVLPRVLAQLQRGDIQIPSAPSIVTELRTLVGKSDSRIETIVALLERDQALVARVLQLGRSAQFSRSAKANDLATIINRIGFRQLNDLVETVWSNDCFQLSDLRYRPYAVRISRHALARALAMRMLAERQRIDAFPAYLIGLFADVGAAFLLWAIVDKGRGNAPDPEQAMVFVREHHESIGSAVLKRWNHSDVVINLVRRHHAASAPTSPYGNLFVVASQMACELTQEDDVTVSGIWPPAELRERCEAGTGLSAEQRLEVAQTLREAYSSALDALAI
jgi:HD-like signal output (HDOD) protein